MKKTGIITILSVVFIFGSCSYKVKDKYSCDCKEEASSFKRTTYEELVQKWGNPSIKSPDLENKVYNITWEKNGLFKDGSKITMEFTAYEFDAKPHGHPNKIWCQDKPYMGTGGMVEGWSGPY